MEQTARAMWSRAALGADWRDEVLQLARSAEPLAPVDLNETIAGVVQMARPRWKDEPEARGLAIAVHPAGDATRAARTRRLIDEGRVHCAVPADYREGREIERRVLAILDLLAARERVTAPMPETEA
jgi:hypothetical protein